MSYSHFKLLFGDIHGHSNLSLCGVCRGRKLHGSDCYIHGSVLGDYSEPVDTAESVDLYYERAKEELNLDFAALTDHDFSMTDEMWRFIIDKASEWYSPGRFTTFNAYEWTSLAYGHRNVYFLDDNPPLFRCVEYGSTPSKKRGMNPLELWGNIERSGSTAITIPHHPSLTQFPVDWSYYSEKFDRLVEIVSIWGVFEYYGNFFQCITSDNLPRFFAVDALERGYKLGFIGGGDTHDCYPGTKFRAIMKRNTWGLMLINSLSTGYTRYFLHNPMGAGLAAVYAEENTRESIFEALYSRRAYAVVGARIQLRFTLNDSLMGEEILLRDPNEPIEISAEALGEDRIDSLEVIKNGRVIHRVYGSGRTVSLKIIDESKPRRLYNYYYVRVIQRDGARAWSSPIWVSYTELGKLSVKTSRSSVQLLNSGSLNLRDVTVAFLEKHPISEINRPVKINNKMSGVFIWTEKSSKGYDLALKVRFKSSGRPINFRGFLELKGVEDYRVDPVGFAIWKYGGDLFRDDYKGYIEWDITPCSHLNDLDVKESKGIDVPLRVSAVKEAKATIDVYMDGKRPLGLAFLGETRIKEFPFTFNICDPRGRIRRVNILKINERKRLYAPKGEWNFLVVYPSYIDALGARWTLKKVTNC